MAASTSKKAIVHRFEREPLSGFVNAADYLRPDGVELLSVTGAIAVAAWDTVKNVCFVKDFQAEDDRGKRLFATRPKMEGLWVRIQFRDGELLDGMIPNNLLAVEPYGVTVVPPDPYSNNQRIFVPRTAVKQIKVMGVIGGPLAKRRKAGVPKDQLEMFE